MSVEAIKRQLPEEASSADLVAFLREVREGQLVSRDSAIQLLHCDQEVFSELLATACYLKEQYRPGNHYLLAESFHPADQSVPRLLRLLHLSPRSWTARCPHHVARTGFRSCETGRKTRLHRGAVLAWATSRRRNFRRCATCLRKRGYRSTLHYLEAMCELVLRETSLLPHSNPGLMSATWIERLRASNPSLGLMLETTSTRLLQKGGAHEQCTRQDTRRCGSRPSKTRANSACRLRPAS